MTKTEALRQFKALIQESGLRYMKDDKPLIAQEWCLFIDSLHRSGQITDKQAASWDNPFYR